VGTSVSQSSPRNIKWEAVWAAYKEEDVPVANVLALIWRAATNQPEGDWEKLLKQPIVSDLRGIVAREASRKRGDWKNELRMPLIQSAYSMILNAELDEVKVGIYNFSDSSHQTYSFGRKQIRTAERELIRLLGQVAPK
jgi:hypothetical protein